MTPIYHNLGASNVSFIKSSYYKILFPPLSDEIGSMKYQLNNSKSEKEDFSEVLSIKVFDTKDIPQEIKILYLL